MKKLFAFILALTFAAGTAAAQDGATGDQAWRLSQSPNFIVLYTGDQACAEHHASLLERACERFQQAFSDQQFQLRPLPHKLTALYFDHKTDYLRYARQADSVDMSWTVAYYSAKTNRVAFYRYSDPEPPSGRTRASDEASALHMPVDGAGRLQAAPDGQVSVASATHEAAHQLAFNMGLQQRGVIYPLWASEGLATNFELDTLGGEFGPDVDNPARSQRLARAWRDGAVRPLREFIAITRVPTEDAAATDELYAQAWGLFRFLYAHHPQGLADYLATMREAPRGHRPPASLVDDFSASFGRIDHLEAQWRAWLASRYTR